MQRITPLLRIEAKPVRASSSLPARSFAFQPAGTPRRRALLGRQDGLASSLHGQLEVALSLPSTLESVDLAEAVVMRAARHAGFDESEQHRIGLAAREAVVNAVTHGNRLVAGKPVRIEVWRTRNAFGIDVQDEGPGFDPERVPDPRHGKALRLGGGRGLCIMRAYMDEVTVERLGELGSRVRLLKRMGSEAA